MKRKRMEVLPALLVLLSALLTVGVLTFLGPCVHEDGSRGTCHWAGRACAVTGGVLCAMSLLALVIRRPSVRAGLYLGMVPAALAAAVLPGGVIPLCMMATMRCQSVMKPAMLLTGILIALLAAAAAWARLRQDKP